MSFRPRIFISSLLRGKLAIRKDIERFYSSVGVDALLYEKNLTPSTHKYTYRQDILDSDFVIVILDDDYGTKTPSGMSGTEEEYNIATANKLKTHVYIKKTGEGTISEEAQRFLDGVKKSGVSYYEYSTDTQLLKRIKETSMSVVREIVLSTLSANSVPQTDCMRLAAEHDYQRAVEIIALYNKMIEVANHVGHIDSNVVLIFMSFGFNKVHVDKRMFIDSRYYDLLMKAIKVADEYVERMSIESTSGNTHWLVSVPGLGELQVSINDFGRFEQVDRTWYDKKWKTFIDKFEEFIGYVKTQKLANDTICLL